MATANNTTNQPLTVADLIQILKGLEPNLTVKMGQAYDQYYSDLTAGGVEVRQGQYVLLWDGWEE